jgi:hypothetical protein
VVQIEVVCIWGHEIDDFYIVNYKKKSSWRKVLQNNSQVGPQRRRDGAASLVNEFSKFALGGGGGIVHNEVVTDAMWCSTLVQDGTSCWCKVVHNTGI